MRAQVKVAVLLVVLAACNDTPDVIAPEQSGTPEIHTSTHALASLARAVCGDAVEVVCPLRPDSDPTLWRPNRPQLLAMQGADVILLNGARLEKWSLLVSLPESRVVRTADGFKDEWITFETEVSHRHGPEGEHVHEGVNPYTWLDPVLVSRQAAAIPHADPARLKALQAELAKLDAAFLELDFGSRAVRGAEPVWDYVIRRYGWRTATDAVIELSPPTEHDPVAALRALLEQLRTALDRSADGR